MAKRLWGFLCQAFSLLSWSPDDLSSRGELARPMAQSELCFYFREGWKPVLCIPSAQKNLVWCFAIGCLLSLLRWFHMYLSLLGHKWWAYIHLPVLQVPSVTQPPRGWNWSGKMAQAISFSKSGFYILSSFNWMGVVYAWGGLGRSSYFFLILLWSIIVDTFKIHFKEDGKYTFQMLIWCRSNSVNST